ncbi:MAG TPA: hypothetical protein VGP24_16110, partial [Glaciihabitans sp.]|nr:hypothetical protein [Glaciihabitans sp.]
MARASLWLGLLCGDPSCLAADVTLSAAVAGKTPEIVGYNSGHFMPGSNTASWWKYSGVNGARVWSTPSVVEQNPAVPGLREDDNTVWGDGVGTQQQFLDRRAAVRANPMGTPQANTYINWPLIQNNYQNTATSSNNLTLNHAFTTLRSLGIEPLVEMDRTNSRYPFAPLGADGDWEDRWEQWQHFY